MNSNLLTRCAILSVFMFVQSRSCAQVKPDTLEINGITVIRDNDAPVDEPSKRLFKAWNSTMRPRRVKTQWGVFDIGFSNYTDATEYGATDAQNYGPGINNEWVGIKPFRSRNINIWILTQTVNLIHHSVNFQYGLGLELNNYFYNQPIRYRVLPEAETNPAVIYLDQTSGRNYKKNKLAADYITVPFMLNFNLAPNRVYPFMISAGISVGYLYASRNKTVTSDEGKLKAKGDFDLRPWKLSYTGDVTLGVITLYGSYAFKSMYKRGLELTPYTFGIRLRPADFFNKLQF